MMIAETSWPDAAIAMTGVLLVLAVAVALIVSVAASCGPAPARSSG
jgi:hypothetical protein